MISNKMGALKKATFSCAVAASTIGGAGVASTVAASSASAGTYGGIYVAYPQVFLNSGVLGRGYPPHCSTTTANSHMSASWVNGVCADSANAYRASIMNIQRRLGRPQTGSISYADDQAIRAFQRAHGLGADGIVGPATARAMGLQTSPVSARKVQNLIIV